MRRLLSIMPLLIFVAAACTVIRGAVSSIAPRPHLEKRGAAHPPLELPDENSAKAPEPNPPGDGDLDLDLFSRFRKGRFSLIASRFSFFPGQFSVNTPWQLQFGCVRGSD